MKDIYCLAIESSCDETACAIIKGGREILSSEIISSCTEHIKFGGVVPEIASRAHTTAISLVVDKAIKSAKKVYARTLLTKSAQIFKQENIDNTAAGYNPKTNTITYSEIPSNLNKNSICRKLSSIRGLYNYLVIEEIVSDNDEFATNNNFYDNYSIELNEVDNNLVEATEVAEENRNIITENNHQNEEKIEKRNNVEEFDFLDFYNSIRK